MSPYPFLRAFAHLPRALGLGLLSLGMTVGFLACGGSANSGIVVSGPPVDRVEVAPAVGALAVGESLQLTARALDAGGTEILFAAIAWSSEDTLVATVDAQGLVTGAGPGNVGITATARSGGVTVAGLALLTVRDTIPEAAALR